MSGPGAHMYLNPKPKGFLASVKAVIGLCAAFFSAFMMSAMIILAGIALALGEEAIGFLVGVLPAIFSFVIWLIFSPARNGRGT